MARLDGLAAVHERPIADYVESPDLLRNQTDLALVLVSPNSTDAGLSRLSDDARAAGLDLLPLLVENEPLEEAGGATARDATARGAPAKDSPPQPVHDFELWSLAGRPLAAGNQDEIDAFFIHLRFHIAQRFPSERTTVGSAFNSETEKIFNNLFKAHYPLLVRFFGQKSDPELARDLAQETMMRVLRSLPKFEGKEPPRSWILTVAANLWRNWLRDTYGTEKRGYGEQTLDASPAEDQPEAASPWPSPPRDPLLRLVSLEQSESLRAMHSRLSPLQRRCLTRWLDGFKYREIASSEGVSLQTVRVTLSKAKARLSRLLSPTAEGQKGDPGG